MISVLLPTRERPAHLLRGLRSLRDLARRRDHIEYLLRVDDDDPTDVEALREFPRATVFSGPRYGYERLHLYVNELAARARGNWLLLWNDDAKMLTLDWDERLLSVKRECVQFLRKDEEAVADCTMPALSRELYRALGHVSLHALYDGWLFDSALAADCGAVEKRNDIVFHHDGVMDRPRGGDVNLYRRMAEEREADARAIRAHLLQRELAS